MGFDGARDFDGGRLDASIDPRKQNKERMRVRC